MRHTRLIADPVTWPGHGCCRTQSACTSTTITAPNPGTKLDGTDKR